MHLAREAAAIGVYLLAHGSLEAAYFALGIRGMVRAFKALLKDARPAPGAAAYAVLGYAAFFAATYALVIRDALVKQRRRGLLETAVRAALFGAAVSCVFNLSNAAMARGYPMGRAAVDVAYATASVALLAVAAHAVGRRWNL